jgi:hypothetical protein
MGKDDNSIPDWQKASPKQEAPSEPENASQAGDDGIPDLPYTEVEEMPPIPTREEAKAFLSHPGTVEADLEDKIRFLEMKNVQREDIEALLPESKARFAKVRLSIII